MSSQNDSSTVETNDAADSEVSIECIRIVYEDRTKNLISHLFVSILPLAIGWNEETRTVTLLLVSLIWLYVVTSFFVTRWINNSRLSDAQLRFQLKALYVQLAWLALNYNALFMYLDYHGVPNAMTYLLLITALYSAGVVGSYQHVKWLPPFFVFFAMFPQCIYYALQDNLADALLFLPIFITIIFMTNIAFGNHAGAIRTLLLNRDLKRAKDEAMRMAMTDSLTSLDNRRAFFEKAQTLFDVAYRYNNQLSVIILDIDKFKRINDTYGHATGDTVIKMIANTVRKQARESDVVGRLGGEEFAVILPETSSQAAAELAERLRSEIEKLALPVGDTTIHVTASFGLSAFFSGCKSLSALLATADAGLYLAKEDGRNRVRVAPVESNKGVAN